MTKTYMLKTIKADRTSYDGFLWPESGRVECPDWDPTPECGGGLHGALMGHGDGRLFCWDNDAIWLVLEIDNDTIVDLGGKVKVPYCDIYYSGDRKTATDKMVELGGTDVIGVAITGGYDSTVTAGYGSTVTAGDRSTVTAGDYSTVTAADWSTVTAGDYSTVTAGYDSTVTGGYRSTVTAGYYSNVTAADYSTVTAGDYSTVTAGDRSTVTGGDYSTVTAGDRSTVTGGSGSTVTGGYRSTVTAGDRSTIIIKHYDGERYRIAVGYVGENGIKANVPYVVKDGKFVEEVE